MTSSILFLLHGTKKKLVWPPAVSSTRRPGPWPGAVVNPVFPCERREREMLPDAARAEEWDHPTQENTVQNLQMHICASKNNKVRTHWLTLIETDTHMCL